MASHAVAVAADVFRKSHGQDQHVYESRIRTLLTEELLTEEQ